DGHENRHSPVGRGRAESLAGLFVGVDGEVAEFGFALVDAAVEDPLGGAAGGLAPFETAIGNAEICVGLLERGDPLGAERAADGLREGEVSKFGFELDVLHGAGEKSETREQKSDRRVQETPDSFRPLTSCCSSQVSMPSSLALSSLLPAFSPTITRSVFL